MTLLLRNARVLLEKELLPDGCVHVNADGNVAYAGAESGLKARSAAIADLGGGILAPGLIDIHVHGGGGIRFGMSDQVAADVDQYRRWVVRHGVTGFLTSISAPSYERLLELLELLKPIPVAVDGGADFLGIHLEGPYINPEKKGAIDPAGLRPASLEEARRILEVGGDRIRQITIAPEIPGGVALAQLFAEAGVTVALGHTNATYEVAAAAYAGPFSHTTHAFNAQSGLHHREPGVIGALLQDDHATAELIADLVHVHPGAMRVLYRSLGAERIALITDAMEAAGLPDGRYFLSGRERIVQDGRSVLADGTIAGSTATLDACVRNLVRAAGIPLPQALWMASAVPARILRADARCGTIAPGKAANLIVLDDDLQVQKTFVQGKLAFER